jgi:hypothetical protein
MADKDLKGLVNEWERDSKVRGFADRLDQKLDGLDDGVDDAPTDNSASDASPGSLEDRLAALEGWATQENERQLTEAEEAEVGKLIGDEIEKGTLPDVDRDYLKMRLLSAYMTDEFFQESWDRRNDDPSDFRALLGEHADKISAEHREQVARENRPLGAAVRFAKTPSSVASFGHDNQFGDVARMSDGEFLSAKEAIFDAAKKGSLR